MSLPYNFIGAGFYTNPASPVVVNVPLTDKPDWFFTRDITVAAAGNSYAGWGGSNGGTYTANAQISSEWFSSMAPGSYLQTGQSAVSTAAASLYGTQGATGGFTFIDPYNPPLFSQVTGTTIDKITFVATVTNTGFSVGDIVRITNSTGMLQIGGYTFQITALTSTTSVTLGYMATAVTAGLTIAANASAFKIQKVIPKLFYPREREIAFITQAVTPKVYFTRPNDFTPGELVDFTIPTLYGMTQLNYLTGLSGGAARVLAVTNTATESSITINLDTSGFTAFTLPTSAQYVIVGNASPAVCYPAGSGIVPLNGSATIPQSPPGTNLVDAFDNRNQYYMQLGTNVCGVASSTIQWMAFKSWGQNAITNA